MVNNTLAIKSTEAPVLTGTLSSPYNAPICDTTYITGRDEYDPNTYTRYTCGNASSTLNMYGYITDTADGATTGSVYPSYFPAIYSSYAPESYTPLALNATIIRTVTVGSSSIPTTTLELSTQTTTASLQSAVLAHSTGATTSTSTSSNSSHTSPGSGDSGGASSRVGGIAGGVVGGAAAIALVASVIWFLARRKRKDRAAALSEISQYGSTPKLH